MLQLAYFSASFQRNVAHIRGKKLPEKYCCPAMAAGPGSWINRLQISVSNSFDRQIKPRQKFLSSPLTQKQAAVNWLILSATFLF